MRLILQIVLILVIISTLGICFTKPQMHKTVLIYDSEYSPVKEESVVIETKEIPLMEKPVEPVKTTVHVEQQTIQTPVKTQVIKNTTTKKQTQAQNPKTKVTSTTVRTEPKQIKTTTAAEKPIQKQVVQVQTPAVKTAKTEEKKVLTPEEENIAWNVWRSNLQNQIMRDVKLPVIPVGTVFKFQFSVDKYGRITNVKTWSATPSYTPYAIQYIAPVIRSYQGRAILNFPSGSTRITTEVTGGWRISADERLSTPQDYNDIEKITK